jgi:sensor histidine kinase YesM
MKSKVHAISIHVLVWILLLVVPYASTYQVLRSLIPDASTISLFPVFVLSGVLIIIFYLNYFFLIPKYLLSRKFLSYFLLLFMSILIALLLSSLIFYSSDFQPEKLALINPTFEKISPIVQANAFLMLAISIVTSILISINNKLIQTEKEKISAQLSSLKSQINPHFLFNTLNNIYSSAIDKSPITADMVDKLSEMMRYTMRETQNDFVPLEDEINYIHNFIELQKMRLDSSVMLDVCIEEKFSNLAIAPMLLIAFVENAFKYGVNPEQDCQIKIEIKTIGDEFQLSVLNNKVSTQIDTFESSGLGIENTINRLNLIYPSKHQLDITESETQFSVKLKIDLQ